MKKRSKSVVSMMNRMPLNELLAMFSPRSEQTLSKKEMDAEWDKATKKWEEDRKRREKIDPGTGPWIVVKKGGPSTGEFEISVVRKNNIHGRQSYGWFDGNKILIADHSDRSGKVHKFVFDGLVKLANLFAKHLNKKESK